MKSLTCTYTYLIKSTEIRILRFTCGLNWNVLNNQPPKKKKKKKIVIGRKRASTILIPQTQKTRAAQRTASTKSRLLPVKKD